MKETTSEKPDCHLPSAICHLLHRPPFIIHHYSILGSTNDHLKQMTDAPEFTCVVADQQTAGRGRRDRRWHSAPGNGLYLSVLLRPLLPPEQLSLLSLMCAIAVTETIARYNVGGLDIKWPNDVLINERKISGILIEGTSTGSEAPRIIAGIGVNLNHQTFPAELRATATSLRLESNQQIEVSAFRDYLLLAIARWYEILRQGQHQAVTDRWQQLSGYALGKHVTVIFDNFQLSGITAGLSENGSLLLKMPTGELRTIIAGEISSLRMNPVI